MAWIESHTVLLRHRKVLQLSSDLGIPPVYVIGHLHALWHAVLEQQENGELSAWSDVMIAQAAAYSSEPKASSEFVAALRARNWLDDTRIHDWIDYAGLFLTKKYSTSNVARLREIWKLHGYKYGKRDAKSLHRRANTKRTESERKANLPNLTKPNLTKPNRREDARDDDFEKLWSAYPWKAGKQEAEKAWRKSEGHRPLLAALLVILEKHKRSGKWTKDHGEYIPRLSTWLNQQRWQDAIEPEGLSSIAQLPKLHQSSGSDTAVEIPEEVRSILFKSTILKTMPAGKA